MFNSPLHWEHYIFADILIVMCDYFSEDEIKGWYKRSKLPHYDNDSIYQFITYRLHDSVPRKVVEQWLEELKITKDTDKNSDDFIKLQVLIAKFEDKGFGECYLKNPLVYNIVKEGFEYFDGERYELIEWIIMPNHIHILIKPYAGYSLSKIVQSWKTYTAKEANRVLGRSGTFWMNDYFDRYIRDENHFNRVVNYIRDNGKKKED